MRTPYKSLFFNWNVINNKLTSNRCRPMFQFIKEHAKNYEQYNVFEGVEIGVDRGINSLNILKNINMFKLYLVDPYKYEDDASKKVFDVTRFNTAMHRLKKHKNYIEFIKLPSSEAYKYVPNNLDFVYIDGDHRYNFVMNDILLWYPKIKNGGIIGGHDFDLGNIDVIRAVYDFSIKNNYKLYNRFSDWWIIKEGVKK